MFNKHSSKYIQNIVHSHTFTDPHNSLLWSSGLAHAVLLYLSVSTHFTLHFPSAAFHIPSHQEAEGEEQSTGRHKREKWRKLCVCFSYQLPVTTFEKAQELGIYLGSSLVPRRTPAPLSHNLEIWDLECKHTGMPLVWPFRNGKMNDVLSVHITCFGRQDYWSQSANSKLSQDRALQMLRGAEELP